MISWLQITSGRGPDECRWVVAQVVREIQSEAEKKNLKARMIQTISCRRRGALKSALIAIEGENDFTEFISGWQGTVQWIGKSMFRPNHKRKNWYVGIAVLQPVEDHHLKSNEFKIETMRASGPGGQHTNKAETAVRVTHIPTGIRAIAQEERSQYLNRKLALARLYEKLEQERETARTKDEEARWSSHNCLERGNPVRTYEGNDFRLKKKGPDPGCV